MLEHTCFHVAHMLLSPFSIFNLFLKTENTLVRDLCPAKGNAHSCISQTTFPCFCCQKGQIISKVVLRH